MSAIHRQLGKSDLFVSPLCFGGNIFGWTVDEAMSFKLLDGYTGAGLNFIDTADIYSRWVPGNKGGESETIIGNWLKRGANRANVIIATKVGMEMGPTQKGLSRDYIFKAVEESLHRLQTDYIDLYQSHSDDESTPLEQTLDAFAQLIKQGKIRAIGASNYNGERLEKALQISREKNLPRYESLQPNYNLYDRADYEQKLEPVCRRAAIGVIPYFSLAKGFLTGKYRSEKDLGKSPRGQGVKQYLNDRGTRILAALDTLSKEYKSTPARISLAWLMARPGITAPIASATNLDQLNDLIESTRLTLSPASIEQLNSASA